jgi:hypothetical protein
MIALRLRGAPSAWEAEPLPLDNTRFISVFQRFYSENGWAWIAGGRGTVSVAKENPTLGRVFFTQFN